MLALKTRYSQAVKTLHIAILQGFGALSFLFIDMLIARLIGITEFGLYATVVSWVYILSILSTLGTNQLVLKYIPEYIAKNNFYQLHQLIKISRLWVYKASLSLLVLSFFIFIILNFSAHKLLVFTVGFLSLPFLAISYLRQSLLRAFDRPFKALSPDFFIKPLLALTLILAYDHFFSQSINALSVLVFALISAFVAYITGEIWLQKESVLKPIGLSQEIDEKKWFFTSLNLFAVVGLNLLTYRIDIVMITALGDLEQVGVYAAASKVAEIIVFGLVSSNILVIPLISKYFATNEKTKLHIMLRKISRWIFIATAPFILIIVFYAEQILSVFGNGFQVGEYALIILVFGQMISLVCGPVGPCLMMMGHERIAVKISAFSAVGNILLNLFLIPLFGMIGAAFATAISLLVVNVVMVYYLRKLESMNTTVF
jgi:O-antigen/teichoic acid export membrane protein